MTDRLGRKRGDGLIVLGYTAEVSVSGRAVGAPLHLSARLMLDLEARPTSGNPNQLAG